jgi:hypothetical protein
MNELEEELFKFNRLSEGRLFGGDDLQLFVLVPEPRLQAE